MKGYQWGEWEEKVQGIRSIISRYKIDRDVKNCIEMEKQKNS